MDMFLVSLVMFYLAPWRGISAHFQGHEQSSNHRNHFTQTDKDREESRLRWENRSFIFWIYIQENGLWYLIFWKGKRVELRNNIKIIPDYAKHVVVEIWFIPLHINLGLKKLFCCSHRQPIYNAAFHLKEVLLSLPTNKTIILISGCMACSAVFICFYGIPTPCVTTYKPRQTTWKTRGVQGNHRQASLFPYIYLTDSYSTSFGEHLTSLGKANLFLAFHLPLVGTFLFYPLASKEFVLVHREGNTLPSSREETHIKGRGSPSSRLGTSLRA